MSEQQFNLHALLCFESVHYVANLLDMAFAAFCTELDLVLCKQGFLQQGFSD